MCRWRGLKDIYSSGPTEVAGGILKPQCPQGATDKLDTDPPALPDLFNKEREAKLFGMCHRSNRGHTGANLRTEGKKLNVKEWKTCACGGMTWTIYRR